MGSKKIKLDIGALTASSDKEGNFMFFLYKDGMEKCLAVPLNAPEMHAVLVNFGQVPQQSGSIYKVFEMVSRFYHTDLIEVEIVRSEESPQFSSRLVFFDGEREIRCDAGFIDGVIVSKMFGCPIFIDEGLMQQYATDVKIETGNMLNPELVKQTLEEQLHEAVNAEDYERADKIKEKLNYLTKN